MPSAAPRSRRTAARSAVVDLAQARDARRLRELEERCRAVDERARRLIARLFECGAIFTRHGSRVARDALLSHQQLLRAAAVIGRAAELDEAFEEGDSLYREAATLVERSTQLLARCQAACARGS